MAANAPPPPQPRALLLDGGTGHLLKEWGARLPGLPLEQQFLAGAVANASDPALVRRAHAAYIAAGADVITTNSFAATRHALSRIGRAGDAAALAAAAARNAAGAREEAGAAGAGVLIAGSLPPLKESYQWEGLDPPDEMRAQYRELAEALAPHADVLLAETLSTAAEAAAVAAATARLGKPLWVSFTLEDSTAARLRSGELLAAAAAATALLAAPHLEALLINCCAPQAASAALPALRAAAPPRLRVGAYANGFRTTTSQWLAGGRAPELEVDEADYDTASGLITPAAYARFAGAWARRGAALVGGCCGVGPEHIRAVAAELSAPGRDV
ncbi:MAG: Homocysteine S-methyltransferase [Monoraphidium minutum]|nr:MAG: Homocysteine S-methyltransferase [Monoraphidium minutum]